VTQTTALSLQVVERAKARNITIATAESCTGGLIAGAITSVAGSSAVFDRGFVTYSNEAKTEMLGVPASLIVEHGAVSAEVAQAMAEGALRHSKGSLSVAVTGIAGPGGGSADKPVGLVYIACACAGGGNPTPQSGAATIVERHLFSDLGRDAVREATVDAALRLLLNALA
jgi:nicotinamide-nucleotide amidase